MRFKLPAKGQSRPLATRAHKLPFKSRARLMWHNWRLRVAFGPRNRLRRELKQHLAQSLEGLERKLWHRHLDALCRRSLAQETNVRTLFEEDEKLRQGTFAMLLFRVVDTLRLENQRVAEGLESLRRQLFLAIDEETRVSLLEAYLREHANSVWSYWADRRALGRRLDLDAIAERCQEQCYRNEILINMAIRGVAHLWRIVPMRAGQSGPLVDLAQFFFEAPRTQTQLILAQEIMRLVETGRFAALGPQTVQRFASRFEERDLDPWVRGLCWRIVLHHDSALALQLATPHLQKPECRRRHAFLLRTLLVQELARCPHGGALVLEHWERSDPSEHVRIRLAQALATSAQNPTRMIAALAKRVCLHHSDLPLESSPKVRACALSSITSLMLQDPGDVERSSLALQHLSSCMTDERDPWVCIQVCRQLQRIIQAPLHRPRLSGIYTLFQDATHALLHHVNAPDTPAALQLEAGTTLALLAIAKDPRAREALEELQTKTQALQVGQRVRCSADGAVGQLDSATLGRVLAHLSRNDWGLYAKRGRRGVQIQRGLRRRTRLWRLIHEFRTPSPNKRKGFIHSRARVAYGSLRAHSGVLHEATQTTVPGERVSLSDEPGWGRYLPLVDDLVTLPGLGAPLTIQLHSSLGCTTIHHNKGWLARCVDWLAICVNYQKLAELRLSSLQSEDPAQRRAYIEHLALRYGIHVAFEPCPAYPASVDQYPSLRIQQLFADIETPPPLQASPPQVAALIPAGLPSLDLSRWFKEQAHHLFSDQGNDQRSLSIFLTGMLCFFLFQGFRRHRKIRRARERIPLCIGGWGTRGKSGTERLKSAMFHGMGYRVFSKTTGCEAMLVHSLPEGPQSEIFVFRPYGKATIWEQANLVQLASSLDVDLFLWECMALNPTYVSILQHGWMQDDISTITNAYPDHEDIQGPAGIDVARVISQFIPRRSIAISSELNFHPLMRDVARDQHSDYHLVAQDSEAEIGQDFLDLFPYQEHPRNIALVAQLGAHLGIDPDLAIFHMAQHVVPDLGVLKTYGDALVSGRTLRFINGCSANERAGFLNSWERTGCAEFDPHADPHRMIATVVNNRADRVSRSEVFAKILVQDIHVDKHILIGTNLGALMSFMRVALREYLDQLELFSENPRVNAEAVRHRFESALQRFRCDHTTPEAWTRRLNIYARGGGLELSVAAQSTVSSLLAEIIAQTPDQAISLEETRQTLLDHIPLKKAAFAHAQRARTSEQGECLQTPSPDEVWTHWCHQFSRALCIHRLRKELDTCLAMDIHAPVQAFCRSFEARFIELFEDSVYIVKHHNICGDKLIERCAGLFPPGTQVTLMGTQNIKGTGLDFVYRWVALDKVHQLLRALKTQDLQQRAQALATLHSFADHGLIDLALLVATLPKVRPLSEDEAASLAQLLARARSLQQRKQRSLEEDTQAEMASPATRVMDWVEPWIEFLDGARRYHQSRSLNRDLVNGRVSHARATQEMRDIYARNKGGWLAKWWTKNVA